MPKGISKGKVIGSIVISVVLEVGVVCLSDIASLAQKYKIPNVNKSMVISNLKILENHPISVIPALAKSKNPIFILGSLVVLIIFLRLLLGSNGRKSKYEIESNYAIHGSSRYSDNDEIFVEGQTVGIPTKQLIQDLIESVQQNSKNHGRNEENEQ
jgi:hypothetical protein